jgi:tripartite-type tricarboxylate transporter receptor subunit TctC
MKTAFPAPFLGSLLMACAMLAAHAPAAAEEPYPSRTIRFIVPYPPGASTDNAARTFARELSDELKTPVIVENKPGAGTTIGALAVRNAPADGYTILFQTDGLFNGKLEAPNLGYEYSDFAIISPLAQTPYALVVPASLNLLALDDLKKRAAAKKGELDFGTLGLGVSQYQILARALSRHLGVKPRLISYKGGIEGVTATMTGDIDCYFATVGLSSMLKDNPRVKLVALTSEKGNNKFLPGLKSFSELGVKDMVFHSLYGVAVRSSTPPAIKARLEAAALKVVNSKDMKSARASISMEDFPGSLDDYRKEVAANLRMYQAAKEQLTNEK